LFILITPFLGGYVERCCFVGQDELCNICVDYLAVGQDNHGQDAFTNASTPSGVMRSGSFVAGERDTAFVALSAACVTREVLDECLDVVHDFHDFPLPFGFG
jgi:hypothetical protein